VSPSTLTIERAPGRTSADLQIGITDRRCPHRQHDPATSAGGSPATSNAIQEAVLKKKKVLILTAAIAVS
jgi:hypothetical protein